MSDHFTSIGGDDVRFASTFTMVFDCQKKNDAEKLLQKLIKLYWKPVYVYIRMNWNKTNEDAKDLTQDFFANFIEKGQYLTFQNASFRSCLKTALKHFLIDESRKDNAIKRGGEYDFISLDHINDFAEAYNGYSPESAFDFEWKVCIINSAIEDLERMLTDQGKTICFRVFKLRELESSTEDSSTYKDIAKKLDISEQQVKDSLAHARKLYRKIVEAKVKDYSLISRDINLELSELFYE